MPEGPSIVILRELLQPFEGKKITGATGYAKIDMQKVKGKKILSVRSWGKHLLITLEGDITIRIHLMMFGSYRVNEEKESNPTLRLEFARGKRINFYTCSVKMLEGNLDAIYEWRADIMSPEWNAGAAKKKLKAQPDMLVCDALLDQSIFSGSGNIVKNEVMYRIYVHPLSHVGSLPAKKLTELVNETRNYAFDFLKWKKEYTLKKHWLAHTKKTCTRCHIPLVKEYLGNTHRRTFYCPNCQVLYV